VLQVGVYICVVSGRVYLCCTRSCIFGFYVIVYVYVVSGRVYLCSNCSCIIVL
jgi:hypothetical protein